MPHPDPIPDDQPVTLAHLIAVRPDGLTFQACWRAAANNPELVVEFDRLKGTRLGGQGTPIERLIDEATGKAAEDYNAFLRFCWNCLYLRVPLKTEH